VVDEDAEHALKVAPVQDQEPVETLGPDGADETSTVPASTEKTAPRPRRHSSSLIRESGCHQAQR
jgi:hypothetical protein